MASVIRPEQAEATPHGDVAFERRGDALVLRFSGAWRLRGVRPAVAAARRELESAAPARLTLDGDELEAWDTSLLAYVAPLLAQARARDVAVDLSALPEGARRLLELAQAVPERSDARQAEAPPGLLARVGHGTLDVASGGAEVLRFVGAVTLAFGRMLALRARFQASEVWVVVQQCGPQALPIVTLISVPGRPDPRLRRRGAAGQLRRDDLRRRPGRPSPWRARWAP